MIVAAFAGFVSIGLMAAINFIIESDFKWFLAALAALWSLAIVVGVWPKR